MFPLIVGGLGPVEFGIIFALIVLLFGAQRIPELARSSGEAIVEFKRGRQEIEQELEEMNSTSDASETTSDSTADAENT